MSEVIFSPEDFREDFPQFRDAELFPERRLRQAFESACSILDNSATSRIPYAPENGVLVRETLLYYLCCHILTLLEQGKNGQHAPLGSTSQGSVSASFASTPVSDKNYYLQTSCGQTFLQMLKPYLAGGVYCPRPNFHPWG